jgi:hypothetical protein
VLFAILVIVSLIIYSALGMAAYSDPALGGTMLTYGVLLVVGAFLVHAFAFGHIRGNAVLVNGQQFPEVHRLVAAHAAKLGMRKTPVSTSWNPAA